MKSYLARNKIIFAFSILSIANGLLTCKPGKTKKNVLYSFDQKESSVTDTTNKPESSKQSQFLVNDSVILKNEDLSQTFQRVRKSVFLVIAENNDEGSQGSGFFITTSGIGISNYHVFKGANTAFIKLYNGETYRIKDILEENNDLDYIVFAVESSNAYFDKVAIAPKNAPIGDRCFAIGNPQGLEQTLTDGIISGYRNNDTYIQTNTAITHGSSGGTLFNLKGEVIGVTSFGIPKGSINFALNIHSIPIEKYLR